MSDEPCEVHHWRPGVSPFVRNQLFQTHGWKDYEYCPVCQSFREKPAS